MKNYAIAQIIYGYQIIDRKDEMTQEMKEAINQHFEKKTEGFLSYYSNNEDISPIAFGIPISSINENTTINISSILKEVNNTVNNSFKEVFNKLEPEIKQFLEKKEPEIFILWSNNEPNINGMIYHLIISTYEFYYVDEEWDQTGSPEARDDKNYRENELDKLLYKYKRHLPDFMNTYEGKSAKIAGIEDYHSGEDMEKGLQKLLDKLYKEK